MASRPPLIGLGSSGHSAHSPPAQRHQLPVSSQHSTQSTSSANTPHSNPAATTSPTASSPGDAKKLFSLKNMFKAPPPPPNQSHSHSHSPQASLVPPSSSAFAALFPDLKNAPMALKPSADDEVEVLSITVHSFTESKTISILPTSDGLMIRFEIFRAFDIPYAEMQQGTFSLFNSKHFGASAPELTDTDLYELCRHSLVPNLIIIPAGQSRHSVHQDIGADGHDSENHNHHSRTKPKLAPLTMHSNITEEEEFIPRKIVETPTTSSPTSFTPGGEFPLPAVPIPTSDSIHDDPIATSLTVFANKPLPETPLPEPPLPPLPPTEQRGSSFPSPPGTLSRPLTRKKLLKRATQITKAHRRDSSPTELLPSELLPPPPPARAQTQKQPPRRRLRQTFEYENLKENVRVFGIRPSPSRIIDNLTEYFPEIILLSDEDDNAIENSDNDDEETINRKRAEKLERPASASAVLMKRETVRLLRDHTVQQQQRESETLGRSLGRRVTKLVGAVNAWSGTVERRQQQQRVPGSLNASPYATLSRLGNESAVIKEEDVSLPAAASQEKVLNQEQNTDTATDIPQEEEIIEEETQAPFSDSFSDAGGGEDEGPQRLVSIEWKRKLSVLGSSGGLFVSIDSSGSDDSTAPGTLGRKSTSGGEESAAGLSTDQPPLVPRKTTGSIDSLLPPLLTNRSRKSWKGYRVVCDSPMTDAAMDSWIPDVSGSDSESNDQTDAFDYSDAAAAAAAESIEVPDVVSPLENATIANQLRTNTWGLPKQVKWTKGHMIGQGSFGKVYFGVNLSTQELMAVKQVQLVPLKVGAGPALVNRNRKLLDALNVEISLLRELQHPNVVNYLGFDVHENLVSVFLEYVDGGSLASILSRFGKFEYEMAQSFTCQILCGLEYLHDRCIIHRDIKGANILVNHLGVVKIADFGISKKNEYKYQPNARLSLQGTVYWMAPEIMLNQGGGGGGGGVGYNSKVDIWSLGCVVYEMLEGHHPWTGFNEMQIMWKVGKEHRAPELTDELSDDVKLFLKLCFAFEPENRPSARELLSSNFANVEPLDFNFEFWLKTAQARRDSMDDNDDDDDDMFSSDCDSE